jgi:UDP-hydrolysing UDP-N-acetyl-D-glucosamine 2-epimerase
LNRWSHGESNKKKICVVTGTRAEYGLLKWLMREIAHEKTLTLQIIAFASHLSPEFGLTYKTIEQDGFVIDAKLENLLSADTPTAIVKSMGVASISIAPILEQLAPDLIVVLGDRYELLPVVQAAVIMRIPIAHLAGGENTEGAYDNTIRNAITKMASLHFVSTEVYRKRIIQMGENPAHVFCVGSTVYDFLNRQPLMPLEQLEESLSQKLSTPLVVVTFHPETLADSEPIDQFNELLHALDSLPKNYSLVFTKANADTSGRKINERIDEYVSQQPQTRSAYLSLGQSRYLSLLAQAELVIGNSSSGIIEAPALGVPTVNIGNRQKGRLMANSVFNCSCSTRAIQTAINQALAFDSEVIVNPYQGSGDPAKSIVNVLKALPFKGLEKKTFFDLEF